MNYHPVLTYKHILGQLEDKVILTGLQPGFRSGRFSETQLITTFQDIAQMHNKKGNHIDISVFDFFVMASLVCSYTMV